MNKKYDLPSIAEMKHYANGFFSPFGYSEKKLGKIGWVLHYGYKDVAEKEVAPFNFSPHISFLSAFILPEKEVLSNNVNRELCWQDLADSRYEKYMSEADKRVVGEILAQGNAPNSLSGHFPVTYEMLLSLCNHPILYLSSLSFAFNYIKNNRYYSKEMSKTIESKTEAITLKIKEPQVCVNKLGGMFHEVYMETCSELPKIYWRRNREYFIYKDTESSRKLRRFLYAAA